MQCWTRYTRNRPEVRRLTPPDVAQSVANAHLSPRHVIDPARSHVEYPTIVGHTASSFGASIDAQEKPSWLREIASKVGVGDEFVRHKFLESTEPSVAAVLAAQEIPLLQLGRIVDKLLPFMNRSAVYAVKTGQAPSSSRAPSRKLTTASANIGETPFNEGKRPKS